MLQIFLLLNMLFLGQALAERTVTSSSLRLSTYGIGNASSPIQFTHHLYSVDVTNISTETQTVTVSAVAGSAGNCLGAYVSGGTSTGVNYSLGGGSETKDIPPGSIRAFEIYAQCYTTGYTSISILGTTSSAGSGGTPINGSTIWQETIVGVKITAQGPTGRLNSGAVVARLTSVTKRGHGTGIESYIPSSGVDINGGRPF